MKTYRSAHHSFAIDIPDAWSSPTERQPLPTMDAVITFGCAGDQAFNIVVGALDPVPSNDQTEHDIRRFMQERQYTDAQLGRVSVGGAAHVWARYRMTAHDWTKKYMLVFGGTEYTITATSFAPIVAASHEQMWDAVVQSFRRLPRSIVVDTAPSVSDDQTAHVQGAREHDRHELHAVRREIAGPLYAAAYEAVEAGRLAEGRALLEQCIREWPGHTLAHKELAVLLTRIGDRSGALQHRQLIKRLDPSDTVNRVNLAQLLAETGARAAAQKEARELVAMEPSNPVFQRLTALLGRPSFQ